MSESQASFVQVKVPETKSPDFRDYYSNWSKVGFSPFDFTIMFGSLNETAFGEEASVTTLASVKMSPQQFKAFALNLPYILTAWENAFGNIGLNPQFLFNENTFKTLQVPGATNAAEQQSASAVAVKGKPPKKVIKAG